MGSIRMAGLMAGPDRWVSGNACSGHCRLPGLLLALCLVLSGCSGATAVTTPPPLPTTTAPTGTGGATASPATDVVSAPTVSPPTGTPEVATMEPTAGPSPATATPPQVLASDTATPRPQAAASATWTAAPPLPAGGMLGVGLRRQTAPILDKYSHRPGFVMCATVGLAAEYFPELEGWIRVLGAPSLEALRDKADEAKRRGVPYEGLVYGLETSSSTPREEWQDLVGSTAKARTIADEYDKLLVMGPGFRLMTQNPDRYPEMAALADMWVLQTQRLQLDPPGAAYRAGVQDIVDQIRAGNPGIEVWAQITLPPDREPSAEEWLAYRQSIVDLVDGTFIGVYTWDAASEEQLVATIDEILAAALEEKE